MKTKLIGLMGLLAFEAIAQNFRIIGVTSPRTFVTPAGTSYSAGMCVVTPIDTNYVFQVSTNMRDWKDRGGFSAHNGQISCWQVPLQVSETNRFFVRVKLAP